VIAAGAAVAIGMALAGACSSGPQPTAQTLPPGTPTTAGASNPHATAAPSPAGTATIGSFELKNQLSCYGTVDVTTAATYETDGAASVAVVVDGTQVPGSPPLSGSFDVPVACDDRSHTVVLVAVDPSGGTTVQSRVVLTSTTPQGN
jgi:hypothetical protein